MRNYKMFVVGILMFQMLICFSQKADGEFHLMGLASIYQKAINHKGVAISAIDDKQFNSKISLEPFISVSQNYTKIKKGRYYSYTWTGGSGTQIVKVELYKDDEKVADLPSMENEQKYLFKLPSSVKPGKSYSIKFTDSNNLSKSVSTNEFRVQRIFPIVIVAIIPIIIAWRLVILNADSFDGSDLPIPIKPK